RRRHTRSDRDWSSDVCSSDLKFVELLEEAGLPEGVVNFCPGGGATFGDAVVSHPKTRYIAFTGSREVGLHINQSAAKQQAGQLRSEERRVGKGWRSRRVRAEW